jgi:2-polyprenyl-3-methyl-5-hydroxy-6-metoxy-1,4-benzoquinol methylase
MLAQEFYDALTTEVLENTTRLNTELYQALRRYYRALADNPERREFQRYSWIRRTEPMVRLLETLPTRDVRWQVLDAGCGLGTESIFWSTLRDDVQVVGVDVSASRLGVAQARHMAYERQLGKPLNVRFLEQDVFSVLNATTFDVVWTMEAISHIDPAEQFLAAVSKNLSDHGHLVVSDSHMWNPAMAWRVLKLRRQGVTLRTRKATSGGHTVSYAQERLLTVRWLSSMLKQAGFASVQTQLSVFFPPNLARSPNLLAVCALFDRVMNRVPVVRNVGGIYTLVAIT